MIVLETKKISKIFPGVKALDEVDIDIKSGEVHALVGENGAGKSTLINLLSGNYQPDAGYIYYFGKKNNIKDPHFARDIGISTVYQEFNLIPYLDVAQNIFLGREPLARFGRIDSKKLYRDCMEVLENYSLSLHPKSLVANLGVAEMQHVEIAKALVLEAKLLILDEPSATLSLEDLDNFFSIIRALKKEGISVLFVSHRLEEVFEIGDRVTVLKDGKKIVTKDIKETDRSELVELMVGRKIKGKVPLGQPSCRDILPLRLIFPNAQELVIHTGEIIGLAGLVGSGRTDLARALFGLENSEFQVELFGERIKRITPKKALKHGMVFVSEDRKSEGVYSNLDIITNTTSSSLDLFGNIFLHKRNEKRTAISALKKLNTTFASPATPLMELSGGNQQKVILARALLTKFKILIIDEPTRGIDVGAKEEIYQIFRNLTEQGTALLLISSELPEILRITHRIYVMYRGTVVKELSTKKTCEKEILSYATGVL